MRKIVKIKAGGSNAYLADGKILIGAAAENDTAELLSQLDVSSIEYIILNQSMPETCSGAGRILELNPKITVAASTGTLKNLKDIIHRDFKSITAKEKSTLSGFLFKAMPGFPWPDCMVVYDTESGVLFSGSMFSSYEDGDMKRYRDECIPYYAQYGEYAMGELKKLGISEILPYRGNSLTYSDDLLSLYEAEPAEEEYTAIVYCSHYGYTKEAAYAAAAAFEGYGKVKMADAAKENAAELINGAKALIIGTPTINRAVPSEIMCSLAQADAAALMGKPAAVFGSYGWSGEGLSVLWSYLKTLKCDVYGKPFRFSFRLDEKKSEELTAYITDFAKSINENN